MKQEMVINVSINNNKRGDCIYSRFALLLRLFRGKPDNHSRALKIAVGISGVDSVSFEGDDKSKMLVKGAGFDAVKLTKKLRKNMGYADLEKLGDAKPTEKEKPNNPPVPLPPYLGRPTIQVLEEPSQHREPVCCSIM